MKQVYNTKQKAVLVDCLEKHKHESLTVDGVRIALEDEGYEVGRSTVYRHLEALVEEGIISRFASAEGKTVTYRFIGAACGDDCHFHLVCTECGEIEHTHCHEMEALLLHMAQEHGFKINERKTLFYGLCKKCGGAV